MILFHTVTQQEASNISNGIRLMMKDESKAFVGDNVVDQLQSRLLEGIPVLKVSFGLKPLIL